LRVACLEEIAYKMGFLDRAAVSRLADRLGKSSYADYLRRVLDEDGA
jgi:glucose-1-phosphate thymidylyltransferase